jgi:hypothetical protein
MSLAGSTGNRLRRREQVSVNPVFTREPPQVSRLSMPQAELDAVLDVVVRNGFTQDLAACLPRPRVRREPERGVEDASFSRGARPRHI